MAGVLSVDEELPDAQRLEIENAILHGAATGGNGVRG
jgi:hypothetical protein